jgi:anti-sigma28 factor (negative regulator of flagellin synthesis)
MAINPIDPSLSLENMKEVKKKVNNSSDGASPEEELSAGSVSDKVELSPEAKRLHDAQIQGKLAEIRGKIESGFYNSDEVLNAVAGSLVKVIVTK